VTGLQTGTARELSSISKRVKIFSIGKGIKKGTGIHKQFHSIGTGYTAAGELS
jgi:hypothetical protein